MRTLNQEEFNNVLKNIDIKTRLKSELKFVSSTSQLNSDWSNYELVAITDRTGNKGLLLLEPDHELYVTTYELSPRIVDASTGRDRAIICDFCYTWQPGSNAAGITFTGGRIKQSVSFLCCGDLSCSLHCRTVTKASLTSRAQLRESN
ncbi:MAG: FBP domain-containing protein [Candidatus Saccharimonadales bacterium]